MSLLLALVALGLLMGAAFHTSTTVLVAAALAIAAWLGAFGVREGLARRKQH
ncbi:hypothetical protein [Streptacidiphilus jiangxiensis]|uniref:Small hydrophobic membrane protein n=1 Tax=Streptacidiphilus jiangxiensis TaxID=235985 RepID=A0A1H7YGC1_STRJI|nr:hypothetical protein [Streptacidiphilus jiangxiensis]SEM44377.1 hypothetical protein SAMN05414137_12848 [Streptacidiphilus jiangxiensis]